MSVRSNKAELIEAIKVAKIDGTWEDPEFSRQDWRNDVANNDTQLGYFDWVIHNLESAA